MCNQPLVSLPLCRCTLDSHLGLFYLSLVASAIFPPKWMPSSPDLSSDTLCQAALLRRWPILTSLRCWRPMLHLCVGASWHCSVFHTSFLLSTSQPCSQLASSTVQGDTLPLGPSYFIQAPIPHSGSAQLPVLSPYLWAEMFRKRKEEKTSYTFYNQNVKVYKARILTGIELKIQFREKRLYWVSPNLIF